MERLCTLDTDPILDLEELTRRCAGKLDLVERVLARFCSRFEADFTELEQAAVADDLGTVARVAHRIGGASASAAAHSIRRVVGEAEDFARRGKADDVFQSVERLREEWSRFQDELPRGSDSPQPGKADRSNQTHPLSEPRGV